MTADCLFCKIISGVIPCDKLYDDADLLAFRDIKPQAPVHVLVIPKRHITTLNDLAEADIALAGKLIMTAKKIASQLGIADSGYRIVNNCNVDGGQTVQHVHF